MADQTLPNIERNKRAPEKLGDYLDYALKSEVNYREVQYGSSSTRIQVKPTDKEFSNLIQNQQKYDKNAPLYELCGKKNKYGDISLNYRGEKSRDTIYNELFKKHSRQLNI